MPICYVISTWRAIFWSPIRFYFHFLLLTIYQPRLIAGKGIFLFIRPLCVNKTSRLSLELPTAFTSSLGDLIEKSLRWARYVYSLLL